MGVDAPVVVGGIIPEEDRPRLRGGGVAAVYTPKDFELARIMGEIADLADHPPRPLTTVPSVAGRLRRETGARSASIQSPSTGPDSKLVISA